MRRGGGRAWALLALALTSEMACRSKKQVPHVTASASPSASAGAFVAPSASMAPPAVSPERVALERTLERWNAATNAADASGLEAVYADKLSFYTQRITRAAAVKRKLDYVTQHAGFSQSIEKASWVESVDHWLAKFRKTSSSQGVAASSVDAFLVFKQFGDDWRIIDEGDVQTTRKIWNGRVWDCPHCKDDPDFSDDPPAAYPPLGPDNLETSGPLPPGAPRTVAYGRALFPRFASAVDVPLFFKATAQSGNGDGRWFYHDAPVTDGAPSLVGSEPKHLLECAIGGHFWYQMPANAKPDSGHSGEPKVKFVERFERGEKELTYERAIYATDGVYNFVNCTFDPRYELYFRTVVQRMGRSMRAISGGQVGRVERESEPYKDE